MAGKGTLVIQLYTARRAIPIIGASVTVSKKTDEETELIAYRTTDQNGATESIEIETPDIGESLSPAEQPADGSPAEQPFTSVNIQIDHPLYYSVLIENAQIFPEQESRQRLQLIPLPEFMSGGDNIIVNVTPQNL